MRENKIQYGFVFFSFFFLGLSSWIHTTFGSLTTLDQIIFHINLGFSGNVGAEPVALWRLSKYLLVGPLILFSSIILILKILRVQNKKPLLYIISFSVMYYGLVKHDSFGVIGSYFSTDDRFSEIYQKPKKSEFSTPKVKRNLILIYVESLETSLRNSSNVNVLLPIDDVPGAQIEKFYQAPGTGWSIAGMISSQCAIPLKPFFGNKADKYATNIFLPGSVCISDILADHDYMQIFMVGPDLKFSGMDKFYSTHKFQKMYGRDELKKLLPDTHFGGWGGGPNDDVLLDAAFNIAKEQHKQGQNFNLTLITTDNHAPEGTPSRKCADHELSGGYRGTFSCTSRMVRVFLDRVMQDALFENTDIFLMGDHLFMANEKQLKSFPSQRYIYFKHISNKNNKNFVRQEMTHFDVAPTILDALGMYKGKPGDFGLGRSLFEKVEDTNYTDRRLDKAILNRSSVYESFWNEGTEIKVD